MKKEKEEENESDHFRDRRSPGWNFSGDSSDIHVYSSVALCHIVLRKGEAAMEEIIEHFGESILCMISGVILLQFFSGCLKEGGILCELVRNFMIGICG